MSPEQKPASPAPSDAMGWWVLSGDNLLAMLRRAHGGEDPDLIYAEEYANSEHESLTDD